MTVIFKMRKISISNELPFIRPCASEIPPMELVREHSDLSCYYWHATTICTADTSQAKKTQHKHLFLKPRNTKCILIQFMRSENMQCFSCVCVLSANLIFGNKESDKEKKGQHVVIWTGMKKLPLTTTTRIRWVFCSSGGKQNILNEDF